jgi:CheY-like chemotaxis protein
MSPDETQQNGAKARRSAGQTKVLLVDDGDMMRKLVGVMLSRLGLGAVVEARNGAEALRLLEQDRFDVVVSDWHMEPVDGLDLLQTLRTTDRYSAVPFVMMTSEQSGTCIAKVEGAQATYLPKPFRIDQLGAALSAFIADLRPVTQQ